MNSRDCKDVFVNTVEEEERLQSLKSKKKWEVTFDFYWFLSFHIERCRKCESHDEDFFFVLKNVSQHLKNRPHGEERKNIFHDIFGENVIMLICWDIHMFQTGIFLKHIFVLLCTMILKNWMYWSVDMS